MEQNGTITKREIKKEHAIQAWRETGGNITAVCKKIGINRKTFYEWLKNSEFSEHIKEEEERLNDDMQSILVENALNGNIRALIYFLEHNHPAYMTRGGTLSLSVSEPILGGASCEPMRIDFVDDNGKEIEESGHTT